MPRRQSFVRFYSPGTMFAETSEKPVESWDVKTACKLAAETVERHGSRPYGFQFVERVIADPVDDGEGGKLDVRPKEVKRSGTHYLNGRVVRFEDANGDILRSNMRGNRWPLCCETVNRYSHMGVLEEEDCIVDAATGEVTVRGNAPELVAYRAAKIAEWEGK